MDKKIVAIATVFMAVVFIAILGVMFSVIVAKQSENQNGAVGMTVSNDVEEFNDTKMSAFELKDLVNSRGLGVDDPIIVLANSAKTAVEYYGAASSSSSIPYKSFSCSDLKTSTSSVTLNTKTGKSTVYQLLGKYRNIGDDIIGVNSANSSYSVSTLYYNGVPIGLVAVKS